jgi:neutral ceramidase
MQSRLAKSIVTILALAVSSGCGNVKIQIPAYAVTATPPPGAFIAGAATVDITPPPGYAMGGHSIGGQFARGYWTKLKARAFYFRGSGGQTVALVSCDLFAIPAGLHSQVAQLLAGKVAVAPGGLIIAAIHTHQGPGNYMSSPTYNAFASPALFAFDQELFHQLASRIADAVLNAAHDAEQASGKTHRIVLRSGYALHLQRNRAIDAFFRDPGPETDAIMSDARKAGVTCPGQPDQDCARYLAVDPTIKVLEVLRQGVLQQGQEREKPIALLCFGAVHATGITHDSPVFGADLIGHAMARLERELGPGVTAGFFNGAEGDVSPQWVRQNRNDAIDLGNILADSVKAVLGKPAEADSSNPTIRSAMESFQTNPAGSFQTGFARQPVTGAAALGGAEDGRTVLYSYFWHGGVRWDTARGDQGVKRSAFDVPQLKGLSAFNVIAQSSDYPKKFPVSVAELGTVLSLAAVPVEMTTLMGRRVAAAIADDPKHFALVGLANEYLGYVTTPEEYSAQDYEGASTLFGPNEGAGIITMLRRVRTELQQAPPVRIARMVYNAGPKPSLPFGPESVDPRNTPGDGLEAFLGDSTGRLNCLLPSFTWHEDAKHDWETGARTVSIWRRSGQVWTMVEDDGASNFVTILTGHVTGRDWATFWIPPGTPEAGAEYRFQVVRPESGDPVCSAPFQLRTGPPPSGPTPPIEPGSCK